MGGERWSFGDHRTPIDFALVVKRPVDVHSADVEQVILVTDQLKIHTAGTNTRVNALHRTPPAELRKLRS